MPIATVDELDAYVELGIQAVADPATSVYDYRLQDPVNFPNHQQVPKCIYFFYIRINSNGALAVDHYFYSEGPAEDPAQWAEIPYNQVAAKIMTLAYNARPSGAHNPAPLQDHNFEKIKFDRKSYVAFFLDEANWAFHKRQSGRFAVVFNEKKAGVPNLSFFDAMDLEFLMEISGGGQDIRTGVVMVNHMKGPNGIDLGEDESSKFSLDMYFDVQFVVPSANKLTVIFDPDGQNQGPPK